MKLGLKFINKKCIYWLHTSVEKLLIITMNIKEFINTPRPYIGGVSTPRPRLKLQYQGKFLALWVPSLLDDLTTVSQRGYPCCRKRAPVLPFYSVNLTIHLTIQKISLLISLFLAQQMPPLWFNPDLSI